MTEILNIMNNQILFYGFLFIFCIGATILLTLIYMDRRNLKSFRREEKNLLDELNHLEEEEEIKITQIGETKETPKANLEEVLEKMQADLDKKEDVVAIFEQEQEEKAIISYQELLQSKNKNISGTNKELLSVIEQIESSGSQDFEESEPINDYFEAENKKDALEEEPKKFKTTDFISPVYGKQENHIEYPKIPNFNELHERGNSIELDKKLDGLKDTESDHNDAFLNALKEFRSHLE